MSADTSPAGNGVARLLAEAHAARAALAAEPPAATAVSAYRLWSHANREPDAPVDFAVARALRADPAVARRYRTLMAGVSVAHAPFAIAAADGAIAERRVGPYTLTLTPAEDGAPPLLVVACGEAPAPRAVELTLEGETFRLALPEPVDGSIVVALDPASEEANGAADAVADPATEIFLI